MVALLIPWCLLLIVFVIIVFTCQKRWKWVYVSLVVLLYINWQYECFPLNMNITASEEGTNRLKVMSFNIGASPKDIAQKAPQLYETITDCNPDVIFLAEFCEEDRMALDTLLRRQYPYSTCTGGYAHYFYSKYPISRHKKLKEMEHEDIGVYNCIITVNKDSLLLYGCHLASNNYTSKKQRITPDSINSLAGVFTYFCDIRNASNRRVYESTKIIDDIRSSKPMPIILMGDLNDVGGSSVIDNLEKELNLKDAWWYGGTGYGATIHNPLPYRIDHVLYSTELRLKSISIISSKGLSDHDALLANFTF